jgi:transposase
MVGRSAGIDVDGRRLFAWLQNYRRIVVRYERYPENFLGMLHLACWLIFRGCL